MARVVQRRGSKTFSRLSPKQFVSGITNEGEPLFDIPNTSFRMTFKHQKRTDAMPEDAFGKGVMEFLAGYERVAGVPLDEGDVETMIAWLRIRSRLFQWALDRATFSGADEMLALWQKVFCTLLEDLDALLLPRLEFWRDVASVLSQSQ